MSGAVMERLVHAARQELGRTLQSLCAAIGAAESAILLPRDDTSLIFFAATNPVLLQPGAPRVPISASFTGIAYRTSQTIAVADASSQSQHYKAVDEMLASRTREFAAIPIAVRRVFGVLTLVNRTPPAAGPFALTELRQAETLAGDIAQSLVQLPGLTGHETHEGDLIETFGADFIEDLTQLHAPERRVIHTLVGALLENRSA
jgi:hypothetical protein